VYIFMPCPLFRMINHEHKFIFIHVPKCAGTSIESLFAPDAEREDVHGTHNGQVWNKHMTLLDSEHKFPDLSNYFKFSFVRNPWSMTLSMYKYLWESNYSWPTRWRSNKTKFKYFDIEFSDYVKTYLPNYPTIRSVDIISSPGREVSVPKSDTLLQWITGKNWSLDFIGKFENLQKDFNVVCDKIKIPSQQLPHHNRTEHENYTKHYDDETRQIVAEKYAKDIEYFGYEFGE